MINGNQKGKAGERELANRLKELGLDGRRSQQYCGYAEGDSDIICEALPDFHIECKRVEKLNIDNAMDQAVRDCGDKTAIVAHRRNRKPWLVTMFLEDFIALAKPIPPSEEITQLSSDIPDDEMMEEMLTLPPDEQPL